MKLEHLLIESVCQTHRGGQHVGRLETEIKVTHVPSGLTATCGCQRTQLRNRDVAIAMIEYGLAELNWQD